MQTEKDSSSFKGERGLKHIIKAYTYSYAGLKVAFKEETAFRLIILEFIILLPVALSLTKEWWETVLLILPLFLCILIELLNSAIENTVDRISLEIHPLSKKAKDLGSAAQMSAQFFLIIVWLIYGIKA
ncbi:MAG: diacylglycerol kinase [Desulfovibrionaceae bacterium]|nr:diacylglycerol kinase [Desulfovibrionaceae bacterium]